MNNWTQGVFQIIDNLGEIKIMNELLKKLLEADVLSEDTKKELEDEVIQVLTSEQGQKALKTLGS